MSGVQAVDAIEQALEVVIMTTSALPAGLPASQGVGDSLEEFAGNEGFVQSRAFGSAVDGDA